MEDKQYLGLIDDMVRQLQVNLVDYNRKANGMTDKDPLLALRIEQFMVIREMVAEFERVLRHLRGEKVEPKAHKAEAVLVAMGSMWTP